MEILPKSCKKNLRQLIKMRRSMRLCPFIQILIIRKIIISLNSRIILVGISSSWKPVNNVNQKTSSIMPTRIPASMKTISSSNQSGSTSRRKLWKFSVGGEEYWASKAWKKPRHYSPAERSFKVMKKGFPISRTSKKTQQHQRKSTTTNPLKIRVSLLTHTLAKFLRRKA